MDCAVVLGMHRSGTSLLCEMLCHLGGYVSSNAQVHEIPPADGLSVSFVASVLMPGSATHSVSCSHASALSLSLFPPVEYPHGYFERKDVIFLNNTMLKSCGCTCFSVPDEFSPARISAIDRVFVDAGTLRAAVSFPLFRSSLFFGLSFFLSVLSCLDCLSCLSVYVCLTNPLRTTAVRN